MVLLIKKNISTTKKNRGKMIVVTTIISLGILLYVLIIERIQTNLEMLSSKKESEPLQLYIKPASNENDTLSGEVNYGLPVRVLLPSINVNSRIENVGLTSKMEMDVPDTIDDVAWYKFGPHPGEIGSAVIAGHYGWKNDKVSAFDKLYTIKIGDTLSVEDDTGVRINFVVREIKNYDWNENTNDIFNSNDGKSHLNLITCNGIWNKSEKSYSQRLVVFTDKID
jgi:LPXTG-site transpeptidase (sortase) family protein